MDSKAQVLPLMGLGQLEALAAGLPVGSVAPGALGGGAPGMLEGLPAGLAGLASAGLASAGLAGGLPTQAALAELNAQALLAGLGPAGSLAQQMVPPIVPLQTEAQTIEALQQAILATINTSSNGNLFAALHTLGAESMLPLGGGAPGQAAAAAAGGAGAGAGGGPGLSAAAAAVPPPAVAAAAAAAGGGSGAADTGSKGDDDDDPPQATGGRRKSRKRASDVDDGDDETRQLANTREKNRLAQRRFREKQKATIAEQRERIEQMGRQLEDYKHEVQLLREENNILRAKLEGRATLHQHMMANAPM